MSQVAKELKKQKEMEPQYFAEDRPTKLIVDTLCKDYDGKQFLKDDKIMETPEKLSINEKQARKLSRALLPYMTKYRRTAEQLGLNKVAVTKPDGKKTNCAVILKQVKMEKDNSAVKAAAVRKGSSR